MTTFFEEKDQTPLPSDRRGADLPRWNRVSQNPALGGIRVDHERGRGAGSHVQDPEGRCVGHCPEQGARVGRCEKAEWSPRAPLLACTEYRVGKEPGPNGKEQITATYGFVVVDAKRGEVKDCGFAIDRNAYRWTPDGRHVIFSGRFEDAQHRSMQPGVFIMRISDCTLLPRISRHGAESPSSPQISPSGRHLVWQNYELGTFFAVPNPLTPELFRANSETRCP